MIKITEIHDVIMTCGGPLVLSTLINACFHKTFSRDKIEIHSRQEFSG